MAEGFATNYAKAIDDLTGKIFIPALICSLLVEFGSLYQDKYNAGLLETYVFFVFIGAAITVKKKVSKKKVSCFLPLLSYG